MHVPYSMDDSEPDLYGTLGSHGVDYEDTPYKPPIRASAQLVFTQDQMNAVLRKHQEHVNELRREILDAHSDGYEQGWLIGYDAGYSQAS